MGKIDFVIMWVDGNDPDWQKQKQEYQPQRGTDSGSNRYRDWDNLQYWFRGVEKFAPWVNRIFFVTWGHVPQWLNTQHPKLCITNHKDFIPDKYLPTFNANPIELNLHRIKALSEQFVFFNDDMFLIRPVKEEDYFVKNIPRDCVIESAVMQEDYSNPFGHMLLNDAALINMHFDKKEVIRQQFWKWFSPVYGINMIRNMLMYPYHKFASFKFMHLPNAFLKTTFEQVWKAEPDILDQVCCNKFRSVYDINQYIMKYWQYVTGQFVPQKLAMGKMYLAGYDTDEMLKALRMQKYKMLCINDDGVEDNNFYSIKKQVKDSFEAILPDKSSYEI